MTDRVNPTKRSSIMRAIKGKRTKLEDRVTRELWRRGIRFRRNVQTLFGSPDIAIKKYNLVVFLDSCFWHGCPEHCRHPQTNTEYWNAKIDRNRLKDEKHTAHYIEREWTILRIWEHQINENFEGTITLIVESIDEAKKRQKSKKKNRWICKVADRLHHANPEWLRAREFRGLLLYVGTVGYHKDGERGSSLTLRCWRLTYAYNKKPLSPVTCG